MTLNGIVAVILSYFTEFSSLWRPMVMVTVVEVRPQSLRRNNVAQRI